MSGAKIARSKSSEDVNVHPVLSPESQKDLESELADLEKSSWVGETRRDLFTAFACGRRVEATAQKNVDVFSADENTDKDLREILVGIPRLAECDMLRVLRTDAWWREMYTRNTENWPCTTRASTVWLATGWWDTRSVISNPGIKFNALRCEQ